MSLIKISPKVAQHTVSIIDYVINVTFSPTGEMISVHQGVYKIGLFRE